MLHKLTKKQIIKESNRLRVEYSFKKIFDSQKAYLKRFIKSNRKLINLFFIFTVIEVVIGIIIPVISQLYLKKSFDLINYSEFFITAVILLILISLFLLNSYFRLYYGEKLTMYLINNIREAWFGKFLKGNKAINKNFDSRRLATKILYHVQLLRMGFQVVITEGLFSALLYISILIFSFIFNYKLFLILLLGSIFILIIFLITYFIGKYYVAREQTFNSRIVSLLADSMVNFNVIKTQGREKEKLKEFDNLIELDTFFRIRRKLWIKYSNRILYGVLLLFGIALYFIQIYWPFIELGSVNNLASNGIILGYFSHILFSTSRFGIFFEAFRVGLKLSLPDFTSPSREVVPKAPKWKTLKIKSKKTKLSKYGELIKNINVEISGTDRILIFSKGEYGKTSLAQIIAGQKLSKSFHFILDKERVNSVKWCSYKSNNALIKTNLHLNTTIGEYLLQKNKVKIQISDINKINKILKPHKIFDFILLGKDLLGKNIEDENLSTTEVVLLQIAQCLINEKTLIVVDHSCFDINNKKINEGLKLLENKAKNVPIIFFSSSNNNNFAYKYVFELFKNSFKKT